LYQALNLPPKTGGPDRRPIREIAREQHRSVDEVIVILQNAIARERPPHPPPGQPTHPESEPSQGRSP